MPHFDPMAATALPDSPVFVGIDVGGVRKGYHLAVLTPDHIVSNESLLHVEAVVNRCRELAPTAIGVDAPCGWSADGRSREAERALAQRSIRAYATPRRDLANLDGFHAWMRQGEALFAALQSHFPLWSHAAKAPIGSFCFETFPHAVTCALHGRIVRGKDKAIDRPALLAAAGITLSPTASQDDVDAALCALTAQKAAAGDFETYGNATEGFIVTPRWRLTPAATPAQSTETEGAKAKGFAKMNLPAARRHAFLCIGPDCCSAAAGDTSWHALKTVVKELGLPILRTKAACLRVCAGGPWLVVYPEGSWYGQITPERLSRIAQEHLRDGHPIAEWISRTEPLTG